MKILVSTSEPVRTGVPMFDEQLLDMNQTGHDKLVLMRISDFLQCARRIKGGPKSKMKAARVSGLVEQGTKFNSLPYLRLGKTENGYKVLGHEGRHRSMHLQGMGYTHVPVLLKPETEMDRVPETIIGEHGNFVTPMMLNYPYIQREETQPWQEYL